MGTRGSAFGTVSIVARAKPRILIVEDNQDAADVLGQLLGEAGYEIRTAGSAAAALAADLDSIDLVISDIGLPDTSGWELMRRIRVGHSLKGVALSGNGTEAEIRASQEAGFSAHLTKPVEFEQLLDTIHRVTLSAPAVFD
jgi:CheY-like chemotaxis protein